MSGLTENYRELANTINQDLGKVEGSPQRLAIMLGMWTTNQKAVIPEEGKDRSMFSNAKYKFLLESPWDISDRCCSIMKKGPVHKYEKETGRFAMTGQMASESRLRTQMWLKFGCNAFQAKVPKSNPMSFWTEQDVLAYIKLNNIPICSVYGDIVEDTDGVEGQMTIFDFDEIAQNELFDNPELLPLKTTGCQRTGCMFCGFGCHLDEGEGRFARMKRTHPKQYAYIMKPKSEGGLGYKELIDWVNEHGNLDIKY